MHSAILINGLLCCFLIFQGFQENEGAREYFRDRRDRRSRLMYLLYSFYALFVIMAYFSSKQFTETHLIFALLLPPIFRVYMRIKTQREIERGMIAFLELLNSGLLIEDDVIKALESTADMIHCKPIRNILKDFSLTMRVSCNPTLAFQKMRHIPNAYMRYVFLNIENVLNSWGSARELIQELEREYISVQSELNKGRAELQNDKMMTYGGLFLTGFTSYKIFTSDPYMIAYFQSHPLFALILGVTAVSGVVLLSMTRISH